MPVTHVKRVIKRLQAVGLLREGEGGKPQVIVCPGTEFCVLAITNCRGAARDLIKQYKPEDLRKAALWKTLSVHLSGCPNNCARHHIGDIGLAGEPESAEGSYAYQLFLGGCVEGGILLGDGVRSGITEEMILPIVDALLSTIIEHRNEGESFQETVSRITPKEIAVLLMEKVPIYAAIEPAGVAMVPDFMEVTS
jgi:sulfite reductase beta subunit-like hemoprotein